MLQLLFIREKKLLQREVNAYQTGLSRIYELFFKNLKSFAHLQYVGEKNC